jgi:hypothetical protein
MKTVYILRDKIGTKQSLGALLVVKAGRVLFNSHVLERGWLDNQRNVSCVHAGIYPLRLEYSNKFKRKLWEAFNVPNRNECKFHSANFWNELNGCFAPGESRRNIGFDAELDMVNSGKMLNLFMTAMGSDTESRLVIIDDNN